MLTRDFLQKVLLAGLALLLLSTVVLAQKQRPAKPIDLNVASIKELEDFIEKTF